eukprot:7579486-Pyramimonas_sp.AAC.1
MEKRSKRSKHFDTTGTRCSPFAHITVYPESPSGLPEAVLQHTYGNDLQTCAPTDITNEHEAMVAS